MIIKPVMLSTISDSMRNTGGGGPATRALEKHLCKTTSATIREEHHRRASNPETEREKNQKRRMATRTSSFDISGILASIEPIQQSLAFPIIAWFDDDEPPPAKRSKNCLLRRAKSFQQDLRLEKNLVEATMDKDATKNGSYTSP
jgi:hypothetical protein